MQKSNVRPKLLAVSAGPTKRLNSPRRPNVQKSKPQFATAKKVVFQKQDLSQISNGKLSVDQVLKQLSCTNEKILNDVIVPSVVRSGVLTNSGSIARRTPIQRSRSSGPALDRKLPGDLLLESFNSVAFRQQVQKGGRQQSAIGKNEKAGKSGQLTPLKNKTDKPKSPRNIHHSRVSSFGPCKCKACKSKRNESSDQKSTREISSAKIPITNSTKNKPRSQLMPKKPILEKSVSLPVTKSVPASNKLAIQNQSKIQNEISTPKNDSDSVASTNKKPFAFLQTFFKNNQTENLADKIDSSKIDQKEAQSTYEINRLSTIKEEKKDSSDGSTLKNSKATALRRHSASVKSISLDGGQADDVASVISYPFPRPRTGSTCCQSYQFMEVMTGWTLPNGGEGGQSKKERDANDLEPFGMFDAIDGGNFINLKDDLVKNRKFIKSRIGIRQENKPETSIQWKRGPILGRGAFGTVWCGLTMAGEMIAVKQAEISSLDLKKAEKEYEKIQQEVDLLKSLSHKNIVGYLGTSLEDRIVSIFMQFIPGGSLTSILKKFGALAEPVVACYTKQILEGVAYLHSKNVVHRDIKGSNVMLMPNAVIKLIDFGCAKRAINLTKSSEEILKSMKGTPYWMAPEVMNETGHGKKSDIWSIGCTTFEMCTSRPPWSHLNRYAALFSIASGTAPLQEIPEKFSFELKRFISECMIRESDKRPDAIFLLNSPFILKYCQEGKRILDSRGVPLNSTKRQQN